MSEKILFLDTEFTQLSEAACLISLALVAESGEHYYVEITDGWSAATCSEFVNQVVIPQLNPLQYGRTAFQAGIEIQEFVEAFGEPVRIATDCAQYDWDFLCQLTFDVGLWPQNADISWLHTRALISPDDIEIYHATAPHHALKDAQIYAELYSKSILRNTPISEK
jgi:hypothetical protein